MFRLIQKLQRQSPTVKRQVSAVLSLVLMVPVVFVWVGSFSNRVEMAQASGRSDVPNETLVATPYVALEGSGSGRDDRRDDARREGPFALLKSFSADVRDGFVDTYEDIKTNIAGLGHATVENGGE